VTGNEDQAQEVVAHMVVKGRVEVRYSHLPTLNLAAEFLVFAIEQLGSPKKIDRPMFCGSHEPGSRVFRDARLRPLLERRHQGILSEVFGQTDIAHHPRKTGDEPGRFHPPDRVDCLVGVGRRHDYRSHHVQFVSAS
jgi:hypothetical protein